MAQNDSDLIKEARALTGYDESVFSDSDFQDLVDIGKEELKSEWGLPDFTFYQDESLDHTRALFWFVCIAAKVRAGEIAGVNLTVGSIRSSSFSEDKFSYWFRNFDQRVRSAADSNGPAMSSVSRSERTYGDQ